MGNPPRFPGRAQIWIIELMTIVGYRARAVKRLYVVSGRP